MNYRIGIDVGGTFTDFWVTEADGSFSVHKTPTTPEQPEVGVVRGLQKIAATLGYDVPDFLGRVGVIVHGTTITTNAVLTGNGAKTALLTTKGFRDLLNMRRGLRDRQYDAKQRPPDPLVPRRRIHPIEERVNVEGEAVVPLNEADVHTAAERLRGDEVEAVAVSYLWSFLDPAHEQRTGRILREALPDVYVSLSSEVLPQIRAYERHSTTVLNATVGPPLARYLDSLVRRLEAAGFRGVLLIMQSNGGVMSPELTARFAANTLLSGPAGGATAGVFYGATHGLRNVLSVDMGGTSFDVCPIHDGRPATTTEGSIGGHRIALPILDIHTIGAGGGSITWIDAGGMLRVGPQSAGARPGPVCYGRGGTEPTVTDADLVLGYLDPNGLLGGEVPLDAAAAKRAIVRRIAEPLALTALEAAEGIYRLVNANMAAALRVASVERGHDPREFALVVAGGAGPLHAGMLARELEVPLVVVPRQSSVFCAVGMLLSDLQHDYVRTWTREWRHVEPDAIRTILSEMTAHTRATLRAEGIPADRVRLEAALDMRYVGQFHEVAVPIEPRIAPADLDAAATRFHHLHEDVYGYAMPDAEIETINVRLKALGLTERPRFSAQPLGPEDPAAAVKGERRIRLEGTTARVPVYDGEAFAPGFARTGPALIEQTHTTLLVPPGYRVTCDAFRNFVMHAADRTLDAILSGLRQ